MKPRTAAELAAIYEQYPGLEEAMDAAAYADYHNERDLRQHALRDDHWYVTHDAAGNKTYKERT